MHYMLVNLLHSHYMQHVMYVITYPLHAFEDANEVERPDDGRERVACRQRGASGSLCKQQTVTHRLQVDSEYRLTRSVN